MGDILVGTAGWTDRTLLESGWYPPDATTPARRLANYAERLPLVEVDATYYHPPSERTAQSWVERTPPGFTFDVKAFSLFTHHPTAPDALPKDLRPSTTGRLYLDDVDPRVVHEVWERFLSALRPLVDAGKLGAILLQFPPWFPFGSGNKRYILNCRNRCAPLPVCVEFRNHTWMDETNRLQTLRFLADHGLTYVCVDAPQGYPTSIPPVLAATADLAMVRFHGHSDKWESRDISERFRYRYSSDELAGWAERISVLAQDADTTHVVMNNCYADYGHTNAEELFRLLNGTSEGRGTATTSPGC